MPSLPLQVDFREVSEEEPSGEVLVAHSSGQFLRLDLAHRASETGR